MELLLALFCFLILVSVLYWAVNRLAPEPIKTYAIVLLVVIATFILVGSLGGYMNTPLTWHHLR